MWLITTHHHRPMGEILTDIYEEMVQSVEIKQP